MDSALLSDDSALPVLQQEQAVDDAAFSGEIDPGRLEIYKDRKLGAGSFGTVFQGRYFGEDVAVKELVPAYADADGAAVRKFRKELAIQYGLSRGEGPGAERVVQLKGALTRKAPYRIVMELMEGSLFELLVSGRELSAAVKVQALLEVAEALEHMHNAARAVTHRDVKSKNILWRRAPGGGLAFKLSDFGEASHTLSITPGSSLHSAVGTAPWMSPEHMQGVKYNRACDVYSLGVVAWEVLTGRVPHAECTNILQIYAKVVERREGLQLPPDAAPRELAALAARCLSFDPAARPTAAQAARALAPLHAALAAPAPPPSPGPARTSFDAGRPEAALEDALAAAAALPPPEARAAAAAAAAALAPLARPRPALWRAATLLPDLAEAVAGARRAGASWEAARAVAGAAFGFGELPARELDRIRRLLRLRGEDAPAPGEMERLCRWLVPAARTLRATRHLWRPSREHAEWGRPFAAPEDAAARLAGSPPGTFVLRLAASGWPAAASGAVAVAYVAGDGGTRHALLAGRTAADLHAEVQAQAGTLRRALGSGREVWEHAADRPKFVRLAGSPAQAFGALALA